MGIPEPLLKALHTNRVVPFIGAGFSYYFGNPSWNDLLLCIAKHKSIGLKLEEKDIMNKDPLQVAESLWQFYKTKNYNSAYDEFNKAEVVPNIADVDLNDFLNRKVIQHLYLEFNKIILACLNDNINVTKKDNVIIDKMKLLANQTFKTIVTTNYDENIEKEIFKGLQIIYPGAGKELSLDEKNSTLYKIHGHVGDPGSIILTQSQYYNFMYKLGFYKSKLYTLFATNVIIMLGYGFRDINVHDIYFQYRRDYDEIINKIDKEQPKAYLVLTAYDKTSLGSYYELYKKFLEGCGIIVIDEGFNDLPEFIELLDREIRTYVEHLGFEDIISTENFIKIKEVINGVLNNELLNIDEGLAPEFLSAILKIFMNPSSLIELNLGVQFDFTGSLPDSIGLQLLNSVDMCIKYYPKLSESNEYNRIVYFSLLFAEESRHRINDFYYYPERFTKFINLCKHVVDFKLPEEYKNEFSRIFAEALSYSGLESGKCHGSANELYRSAISIPESIFNTYLDGRFKWLSTRDEIDAYVSNNEITWLEYFAGLDKFPKELKHKINAFISKVRENKRYYR